MRTELRPDLDQARQFLQTLAAQDPSPSGNSDPAFTFQTFDDSKEKNKLYLARILHGTFSDLSNELVSLNRQGAGVFVCVNRTDLLGRTEKNISSVRGLFVDSDDGPVKDTAVRPNILVESVGGQHAYWLTPRGEIELDAFSALQHGLANSMSTDPKVRALPQVMRIPGFFHQKKEPRLVRLLHAEAAPLHSVQSLMEGLRIDPQSHETNVVHFSKEKLAESQGDKIERCRRYMQKAEPAIEGRGGDLHTLRVAMIGGDFDLSDSEFWPILADWNSTCQPPWSDEDLQRKLVRANKYRRRPYGWRLVEDKKVVFIDGAAGDVPPGYWERVMAEADEALHHAQEADGWDNDAPPPRPPRRGSGSGGSGGGGRRGGDGDGDDPFGTSAYSPQHGPAPAEALSPRVMGEMMIRSKGILQHVSKAIYLYDGRVWNETSRDHVKGIAMQFDHFSFTTDRRRTETVNHVLARTQLSHVEWNNIQKFEVPLRQGVLNVINKTLRKHSPRDFLDTYIPHKWDPDAACPTWMRCLEDWFRGEADKKLALQEFFGYILLAGTNEYKKALFLYGESNTGKSVVASVAREMVGISNLCQVRLEDMDDPKKRSPVKGKLLNLITEVGEWSTLNDSGFKMLVSTGDPVEIEKKFVNSMTIIPTCKHMIATNNLPRITDQTKAVYNRLLILEFKNIISQNQMDPHLLDRLTDEMQGILAWAVEGACRLVESSGNFTRVESSENIIKDYKETNNEVTQFIEHGGVVCRDPEGMMSTTQFRDDFNKYKGGKPVSARMILKWARAAGLDVPAEKRNGYRQVVGVRRLSQQEQAEAGGQLHLLHDGRRKKDREYDI